MEQEQSSKCTKLEDKMKECRTRWLEHMKRTDRDDDEEEEEEEEEEEVLAFH
jgi:hypothetical protein